MKIGTNLLFLITSSDGGGAQKHLYDAIRLLCKEKYSIEVACAPGGPLIRDLGDLGIKVFPIPELSNVIHPVKDLLAFTKIYRLIKRGNYDIVHCHSTKAGILGRMAAWLAGVPAVLFTAHGFAFQEPMPLPKKFLLVLMEKIAAAACHRIITVSENDRRLALRLRLKTPSSIETIYNGIDFDSLELPNVEVDKVRGESGLGGEEFVIGSIANFYPNKGYPYLLKAAELVIQKQPKVKFIFVGDGPLRKDMMDIAKSLGINGRAIFTGYISQVLPFLSLMDVFVLASIKEGFPFSLLEAMAVGKPIIATAVGGIPEIIKNYETGILIKPADPYSMAEAILKVFHNRALREELARNAKERVKHFSLRDSVQKLDNLYDRLLSVGQVTRTTSLR
ncbi:MAG: glycosyltransferase family 4 protein [Candidatus Brocadiaceae bacterium]|nr:glycosyltransferase family 4 protein [Candidatus Brocadiaceae bacterium]